jgi:hypothetical protein
VENPIYTIVQSASLLVASLGILAVAMLMYIIGWKFKGIYLIALPAILVYMACIRLDARERRSRGQKPRSTRMFNIIFFSPAVLLLIPVLFGIFLSLWMPIYGLWNLTRGVITQVQLGFPAVSVPTFSSMLPSNLTEIIIVMPITILLFYNGINCITQFYQRDYEGWSTLALAGAYLSWPSYNVYSLAGSPSITIKWDALVINQNTAILLVLAGLFGLAAVYTALFYMPFALRLPLFFMNMVLKIFGAEGHPWTESGRQVESAKKAIYLLGGVYSCIIAFGVYGLIGGTASLILVAFALLTLAVWLIFVSLADWFHEFSDMMITEGDTLTTDQKVAMSRLSGSSIGLSSPAESLAY